jgi:hypothetical protein
MSTPNAVNPSATNQNTQTFSQGTITPPTIPTIYTTKSNIYSSLIDQLAGFQIGLFQNLFPISIDPNYRTEPLSYSAGTNQLDAIQANLNNILLTVISVNQITNNAANRVPANSSIDTNPPYDFIDGTKNTVILAINKITIDIIYGASLQAAQSDYKTLRDLLNPIYNY